MKTLIIKYQEAIKYILIGGITTLINLSIYLILTSTIFDVNNEWQLQTTNVIAWTIAVTFAYTANRTFVFQSKNNIAKEMLQFYTARLITLGLEVAIMYIFVTKLKYNDKIIKVITQIILIISNYLFSKLVIFKKKERI